MEISGKIIQVLPLQEGVSKAGNNWKKQEYVLETHDTYPRKVKFDFFGERVDQNPLAIGDEVTISFDLESREFNGRWYTDVRAWKSEKVSVQTPTAVSEPASAYNNPEVQPFLSTKQESFIPPMGDESDDLPF